MSLPSRFLCALVFVALAVGLCPARADDVGDVKEKLFQAKKAYDAEAQKFRQAVAELLDQREEAARKAGNKKALDAVKAERDRFDKTGEPPATVPLVIRQQITTARGKLDKSYSTAVKDYVRLKEDSAADAVEKERQEFTVATAFLFGRRMHLTTLKPVNVKSAKGGFEHDITLKIQEGTIPHSIRLDAVSEGTSQVSYTLAGKGVALRARVGVPKFNDTVQAPASELTFEVLGDEKSLWKSKPTDKLDEFQTCEIILEKVQVLSLRIHCPKSAHWGRGCWLEPVLAE